MGTRMHSPTNLDLDHGGRRRRLGQPGQLVEVVGVARAVAASPAQQVVEDGRHDGEAQGAAKGEHDAHERDDGGDVAGEEADGM